MLFTTPSQYLVLLLMLVVGWLFGFASHSGGRKWKRAYREEQAARTEERRTLEARNADLTAERDSARAAANARPAAASAARPADPPRT